MITNPIKYIYFTGTFYSTSCNLRSILINCRFVSVTNMTSSTCNRHSRHEELYEHKERKRLDISFID